MSLGFLNKYRFRQIFIVLAMAGALLSIFPPETPFFQRLAANSIYLSLAYAAMGILLLALQQSRLMYVCLVCSGVICFFFNETHPFAPYQDLKDSHPLVMYVSRRPKGGWRPCLEAIQRERVAAVSLPESLISMDSAHWQEAIQAYPHRYAWKSETGNSRLVISRFPFIDIDTVGDVGRNWVMLSFQIRQGDAKTWICANAPD